ncbi:MAG: hypothetical protein IPM74_03740 [Crocinitomicaceae bacterium]|nr:hypothetical protein [Crocinitomicaceae bacterium]
MGKLSEYIKEKYGEREFKNHSEVEPILLDSFQFLCDEFKKLIYEEKNLGFFLYTFLLHEESIKLYLKILNGFKLHTINSKDFAMYRRILKLVLEQGCDIDLAWGSRTNPAEVYRMDCKMQELIYIGTWMYGFGDHIAFQKMVEECHKIGFNEEGFLSIQWQHHYGVAYDQLFPQLIDAYKQAVFDEQAMRDLKDAIENCFGLDYNFAGGVIFEIKKLHSPESPTLQTIQPHVLPLNLIQVTGVKEEEAKLFYDGLTISRSNKLSLENAIYKPYSMDRYMYRPILVYNVGGEERALVGQEKFAESMMVIATNALHWNALPKEWLANACMLKFMNQKGNDHDKILEDKIEAIVKTKGLLYCRNIESFKQLNGINVNIIINGVGEIDFIIVHKTSKTIFVADTKYNRARYEAIGYRADHTNFTRDHEPQLSRKVTWVKNNGRIIQEHLSIVYNQTDLDLTDFSVQGVFLINTPTFYMFNGRYHAITLNQLPDFLDGNHEFPTIIYETDDSVMMVQHPYFTKPILLEGND